jgi:hypothetical protein
MGCGRTSNMSTAKHSVLSVLRSKQVVLDGQDRLDRLAGLAVKSFAFSQVVENNLKRE